MEHYARTLTALLVLRATPTDSPLFGGTPFGGLTPSEFEVALKEMRAEHAK